MNICTTIKQHIEGPGKATLWDHPEIEYKEIKIWILSSFHQNKIFGLSKPKAA